MRSRYKFTEKNGVHFITATIVDWLPIFTSLPYFQIICDSLTFCQTKKSLEIFAFVILENHIHLIARHENDLSAVVKSLKMFTAKSIIDQLKNDRKDWALHHFMFAKKNHKTASTFQIWQEGNHPQLIQNKETLFQKVEYIHNNPVKRGYVEFAEHWKHSSANFYATGASELLHISHVSELLN